MLYEIHMLKNYPPTNLNRDDTGAPKTCLFGGVTRGRISSQCLKRSWRTSPMFIQEIGENNLGIRTRKLPELVFNKLIELGVSEEYAKAVEPAIAGIVKKNAKEQENTDQADKEEQVNAENASITAQVVFYSEEDILAVANTVEGQLKKYHSLKDVKKKITSKTIQEAIPGAGIRPITLDIALFGRMVTCNAFRNVEASMQVAHAISTHKITVESDYFTAMDDLLSGNTAEESGAAILSDTDYNSSCYYIYASLDTDLLMDNLKYGDDAAEIVKKALPALLRAMAFTNPSGKQNSFAGHVLPAAVMIDCKEKKIPVSLVNAFAEPVRSSKDIVKESIQKLADEADMITRNYELPVRERIWFAVDKYDAVPVSASKICRTFNELVDAATSTL